MLIDEDTCATNFMIRDNKMMQLVACDKEPITPFVSVIQSLKQRGISTVLVVGGTGDFFDDADVVLVMDSYRCEDATTRARQIAQQSGPSSLPAATFTPGRERSPVQNEFYAGGKVKVLSQSVISYGDTELSLHALEQIVCAGQSRAISQSLQMLATTDEAEVNGSSLRHHLAAIERSIDQNEGLSVVDPGQFNGALVRPRLLEVGAAANRLRRPCFHQH